MTDAPAGDPPDDPSLWLRLGRHPLVQVALFALALAGLYLLDRLTRPGPGPHPLASVLGRAALIAAVIFAVGWLAVWLRRRLPRR